MLKLPKAKYNWELKIWNLSITCAVLDNGVRIVSNRSFANFIWSRWSSAYWEKKRNWEKVLPEAISLSILKPYISEQLRKKLLNPFKYESVTWTELEGIDASVIPEIVMFG